MSSFLKSIIIINFNCISGFLVLLLVNICIADYGEKIYFELSTRNDRFQTINVSSTGHNNLLSTTFNVIKPTKVIIHGYNSNSKVDHLVDILRNYLYKYDCNVIMVDWSYLAANLYYPTVISHSRIVALYVARLFLVLMKHGAQNIHVVGQSGCSYCWSSRPPPGEPQAPANHRFGPP
ncbi:GSCOCG00007744001-RA-CDS [Cotesia congregata]|nr:GSCOCG00007744001-RA-CDS [Cotesia congregata]